MHLIMEANNSIPLDLPANGEAGRALEEGAAPKRSSKCCSCCSSHCDAFLKVLLVANLATTALTAASAAVAAGGGGGMTAVFVAIGMGGASLAAQTTEIVVLRALKII